MKFRVFGSRYRNGKLEVRDLLFHTIGPSLDFAKRLRESTTGRFDIEVSCLSNEEAEQLRREHEKQKRRVRRA